MTGSGYKGGSYKGLDISFGGEGFFGGVLIRALEDTLTGDLVVGPCRVADHVLRLVGSPTIAAFVERNGLRYDSGQLVLERRPGELPRREVYSSARVGMSLKAKRADDASRALDYWGRALRFMTNPAQLKSHPVHLALAMFARGHSTAHVAGVVGCNAAAASRWLASYQRGASRDPSAFFGKALSVDDICQLYGALYPAPSGKGRGQ
jgi:hypothetical protein